MWDGGLANGSLLLAQAVTIDLILPGSCPPSLLTSHPYIAALPYAPHRRYLLPTYRRMFIFVIVMAQTGIRRKKG